MSRERLNEPSALINDRKLLISYQSAIPLNCYGVLTSNYWYFTPVYTSRKLVTSAVLCMYVFMYVVCSTYLLDTYRTYFTAFVHKQGPRKDSPVKAWVIKILIQVPGLLIETTLVGSTGTVVRNIHRTYPVSLVQKSLIDPATISYLSSRCSK